MEPSFLVFLQKSPFNMVLFGTAVVTGGMLVWPLFGRIAGGAVPQVGAFEAVNLINRRDAAIKRLDESGARRLQTMIGELAFLDPVQHGLDTDAGCRQCQQECRHERR